MNKDIKDQSPIISGGGFTLLETIVSMAIALVVMGAIYSAYQSQQRSYVQQDQVSGVQQNLRTAMYIMSKDIRIAGYDPKNVGVATFGIANAAADTLTFTADLDEDGVLDANETITYTVADMALKRNEGGGAQVLAENVYAVGFAYAYDNDGDADHLLDTSGGNVIWAIDTGTDSKLDMALDTNANGVINGVDDTDGDKTLDDLALTTAVSIQKIAAVRIWILARTDKEVRGHTDTNTYVVGNRILTPGTGYIYKLLTGMERCRNL